jgi:hypothetical protein
VYWMGIPSGSTRAWRFAASPTASSSARSSSSVDDIELEHFFRQSRVEGQVRREIMRRLPQAGLRAGTPWREVRLVDGPGAGTRSEPGAEPGG